MFIFRVTDLLVAQTHFVIVSIVQHAARHKGLASDEGCSFGYILHRTNHSDVTLQGIRTQVPQSLKFGLAVAVDGRLEVSAKASHAIVRGWHTARVLNGSAIRVTGTFFGFYWRSRWRWSLLIRVGFSKSGQRRRTDAKQHN